jgi:hypothetical protein
MTKSIKYISLLTFILLSCTNPKSILPEQFRLKRLNREYQFNQYIYEYSILNKNIDYEDLKDYPIRCERHFKDCFKLDWKNFNDLGKDTLQDINDFLNFLKQVDNKTVLKLNNLINENNTIYFSGCYRLMKINAVDKHPAWEYKFFIDLDSGKLFAFDYTEDFLLPYIPNPF